MLHHDFEQQRYARSQTQTTLEENAKPQLCNIATQATKY